MTIRTLTRVFSTHRPAARPSILLLSLCLALMLLPETAQAEQPTITLDVPSALFIGNDFTITATFDNTAINPGYGPFIDLVFPVNGADGQAGTDTADGIDFVSATYLGQPVTKVELTFPDDDGGDPGTTGCVQHPYALDNDGNPVEVCGTAGDKLVVLQLPFGSFTNEQPPAEIAIQASLSNLADLGTTLTFRARAGFQYGADALDNPSTDPSILSDSETDSRLWTVSRSTTPTLLTLTKSYIGPESETATGPNFPRRYTIDVDVATDQTISDLDVIDELPNNLAFLNVVSISPGTGTMAVSPTLGTAATAPNNQLLVNFSSITGSASSADVTIAFEYFVPQLDADGISILDPTSGDDVLSANQARAIGDWTPIDIRDAGGTDNAVVDPAGTEHTLTDKSIAIQKSVSVVTDTGTAGATPGDTLEYTLSFQVSDFFAFQNVVITDTLSDGQHFDNSFTPTLSVSEHGSNVSGTMDTGNFTVVPNYTPADSAPNDGTTTLTFRISDELVVRATDAQLLGGCVPAGGTGGALPDCATFDAGGTTGTLVFRTVIQENFSDTYPSGDPSVDQGDSLSDSVTIDGALLSVTDLVPNGESEADTSDASITVARGTLAKSVYALNGSTSISSPFLVAPADTVTYRLQYTLISSDIEDLQFSDYLPLPVLYASEVTTFDPNASDPPPAGTATYGPNDTFHDLAGAPTPTLSTDATANRVAFTYGDYDDPGDTPTMVDLLFTVTVSDDPFAGGLFLTNQVRQSEGSTNSGTQNQDAIAQIKLTEPVLSISKGVIGTDSTAGGTFSPTTVGPVTFTDPGGSCPRFSGTLHSDGLASSPIDSDLTGVDAGDLVTFAIVVENSGASLNGAFDVGIKDTLPTGFVVPGGGLNLCITDGSGAAISYSNVGGGSGLLDQGIELTDPGPTSSTAGALDEASATSGRNIAIITYDLAVDTSVEPLDTVINMATLFNYAGSEGGQDHTDPADLTDEARVTMAQPTIVKTLTATDQAHTSGNNVTIGEVIAYALTVELPEGTTPTLTITDSLPAGLAYVANSVTVDSSGFNGSLPAPSISAAGGSGDDVVVTFGRITVADDNDIGNNRFVVHLQALVQDETTNVGLNPPGRTILANSAVLESANGLLVSSGTVTATLVEPQMAIGKTIEPAQAAANDPVTVTLTVQNTGTAAAFDVIVVDPLPVDRFAAANEGFTPADFGFSTQSTSSDLIVHYVGNTLPAGETRVFTFTAELAATVQEGDVLSNTATVSQATTLPGADGNERDEPDVDASDTVTVIAPDIVLDKEDGQTTIVPGYTRVYTLTVSNRGDRDANGVTITDTVPVSTTFDSAASSAGWNCADGDPTGAICTYSVGDLASGESRQTRFALRLDAVWSAGADALTNSATAGDDGSHGTDPTPDDNSDNDVDTVLRSSLGDFIWFDVNGNGLQDSGEAGLDNVVLHAMWAGPDSVFSSGDELTRTLVTAADGSYLFRDLPPGLYRVRVETNTLPTNLIASFDADGGNDSTTTITLAAGEERADVDFGYEKVSNLTITKQVALYTDSDANGMASPHDTLRYTVTIRNDGKAVAGGLLFNDTPDANTTLVTGSVQTGQGTVTIGNTLGDTTVSVDVGDVSVGETVTLTFDVTIDPNIATGIVLANQGSVDYDSDGDGNNDASQLSDGDPEQPGDQSTDIAVGGSPQLVVSKQATDLNGGHLVPGDRLGYEVTIQNVSGFALSTARFNDAIPAYTTFVPDSLTVPTGSTTVTTTPTLQVSGVDVPANSQVVLAFQVQLAGSLPAGVSQISNQANVDYDSDGDGSNDASQLSDGDGDQPGNQPTLVPVTASPELRATKRDGLALDADGDSAVSPGDTLSYEITVTNSGNQAASGVVFEDLLDDNTTLVTGSVQTSQGTVTGGNQTGDDAVRVAIGTLPSDGRATLRFQATVNEPWPQGITQISNQGTLSSDQLPDVASDDPDTDEVGDPTNTPLTAPALVASKSDWLAIDADGDGVPGPGDTIAYTVTLTNNGNRAASDVTFSDTPDANTSLVVGSVQTSRGTVDKGNKSEDASVTVSIGTVPSQSHVTLAFQVTIDRSLPHKVERIANQGAVSSKELPTIPSDDPNTDAVGDPTVTLLRAKPKLAASKQDTLLVDADGDNDPSPGDTLFYQVTFRNNGQRAASGVVFDDRPDPNTTLVVGSVQASQGKIVRGNANADNDIVVNIGTIPAGASATVGYQTTINTPLPTRVTRIANQAVYSGANVSRRGTDDPATPAVDDPTGTTIGRVPLLTAYKSDLLLADADDNRAISAGDTLLYRVTIANQGTVTATNVIFTDTLAAYTTLVVGSVQTDQGTVSSGNSTGDASIVIEIGAIPGKTVVTLSFRATVDDPLPKGINHLENQGVVSSTGTPNMVTDDPDTPEAGDVTVSRFPESAPPSIYLPIVNKTQPAAEPPTPPNEDAEDVACPAEGCGLPGVVHPKSLAVDPDQNALYVTSRDSDRLLKVDTRTNQVLASVVTGREPWDVVINERANRIYVSNYESDDVWVYDADSLALLAKVGVGPNPALMAILPDIDTVAVMVRGMNGVAIIEGMTLKQYVGTTGQGGYGLAADPTHNQLVVTNRDAGNGRVLYRANDNWRDDGPELHFGERGERVVPFGVAYNSANNKIYVLYTVSSGHWFVDVFEVSNDDPHRSTKQATVEVGNSGANRSPDVGGTGLAVNHSNGHLFVANTADNTISLIDGVTDREIGRFPSGTDPFAIDIDPDTNRIFVLLRAINRFQKFSERNLVQNSNRAEQNTDKMEEAIFLPVIQTSR